MHSITDDDRPLAGSDYPWLCPGCKLAVDTCAAAVEEGPDEDDPEAACNLAYDLRLFCAEDGMRCANPPIEWIAQRMARYLTTGDVYACPACGKYSAFDWRVADDVRIPLVRLRIDPDHRVCGHLCPTGLASGKASTSAAPPEQPRRAA